MKMEKTIKISAQDIQKLREATSAGVMDCKKALSKAGGSFDQAIEVLKERGVALAAKKSSRTANQGRIEAYVHLNNKIGVLVEVNCETDFVARCDDFKAFTKDIAMQIAALNPGYVKREDVTEDAIKRNKKTIEEFYKQNCLLEQSFVKDPSKTIRDYLTEVIAKIGENILINRFKRFQLGE